MSWIRTGVSRGLVALVLLAAVSFGHRQSAVATATAPAPASVGSRAVAGVAITVSDADRAAEFYSKVLTFEKVSDEEVSGDDVEHLTGVFGVHMRIVRMRLGDETIDLVEYLSPRGRPIPVDSRSNDGWFQHIAVIVSDMDRAYARLRQFHVEHASPSPQRLPDWNPNAGGIRAFYFKDPDGHPVEILWFPPDKGAPKWHRPSDKLFLGIDHTAIVVTNTDASLAFYRDALGLAVAGESENYGIEQERLNNVFGAHLRITALRASTGIGIEFLEYLSPRDGRAFPADERSNDIVHRETEILVDDAGAAGARLRLARAPFISSGVVDLHDGLLDKRRALVARDPDGHAVELFEDGGK